MDLIDREALYKVLEQYFPTDKVYTDKDVNNALVAIQTAPTVDAEPVRHGKWENYPSHTHRRCSLCKMEWEKPRFNIRANYCPNCGAKMG